MAMESDTDYAAFRSAFRIEDLAAHAYPREVEFVDELPKTPSGKIQRFVLRQREVDRSSKSNEN